MNKTSTKVTAYPFAAIDLIIYHSGNTHEHRYDGAKGHVIFVHKDANRDYLPLSANGVLRVLKRFQAINCREKACKLDNSLLFGVRLELTGAIAIDCESSMGAALIAATHKVVGTRTMMAELRKKESEGWNQHIKAARALGRIAQKMGLDGTYYEWVEGSEHYSARVYLGDSNAAIPGFEFEHNFTDLEDELKAQ